MRESLRAARRLSLAVPVTALAWSWATAARFLLAPWPQVKVRWQGAAFRFWGRSLCRIFGIRVRVVGRPPRPPFILTSNHLSYADILVLGSELPCVFVAKAEIDRWPLFGALCRSVHTIFIDRKAKRELRRTLDTIRATLDAGQAVVFFPEGTSGAGHAILPFRSPLLDLPARLGSAVHWARLRYAVPEGSPPVHLAVTWWADMPLLPHLRGFLRLRRIDATLEFGDETITEADRKVLAERLWSLTADGFEPMVAREEVERIEALRESDPSALPAILRPRAGAN